MKTAVNQTAPQREGGHDGTWQRDLFKARLEQIAI
jgi:hypothetical protein